MKVLKPVVALSAVALSTAVWAKTPRFPTPETVSDEMAQTVARPEDPIWANAPASLAEWKDTVANYIKTISATALETAKALKVDVKPMKIASVNVNVLMPEKIDKDKEKKVIYYIHGSGYVLGHGASGIREALPMAALGIFILQLPNITHQRFLAFES